MHSVDSRCRQILFDSTYKGVPRIVRLIELESISPLVGARVEGGGEWELAFNGDRVSV